jgi:hypothetical protein
VIDVAREKVELMLHDSRTGDRYNEPLWHYVSTCNLLPSGNIP